MWQEGKENVSTNLKICGATYSAVDLIYPKSLVSGSVPTAKNTQHSFFKLSKVKNFIQYWVNNSVNIKI